MSLFLPLAADQFHSKPMAISSITSPAGISKTAEYETNISSNACPSPSPSSSSAHSSDAVPAGSSTKSGSLSPPSRTFSNYSLSSNSSFSGSPNNTVNQPSATIDTTTRSDNPINLPQPTTIHPPFYNPYHFGGNTTPLERSNSTTAPLSLYERRLRNKTASAKYRAKKNQQQGEMRSMISSLTKDNELLLRQLDHIQRENNHLKATCDRLRGKIIAQKMLKQYLVETEHQQQQQFPVDQSPNCFTRHHPSVGKTFYSGIADMKGKWDEQD
jgi:hypothetical protein